MTNELCDYHIHSNHSFDSEETIENICKKAISKNLSEICITDHFSILNYDPSYKYFDFNKYKNEIDKVKEKYNFPIKRGLEIGEGHLKTKELEKIIESFNLDFIIGSIHNISELTIRKSLKKYGEENTYKKYFKELKKLAENADYDVLGHLDLVQRYAFQEFNHLYNVKDYKNQIEEILSIVIKREKGIEVNTSSLYKNYKNTFPKTSIIKMYHDMGGKVITIGSDAHNSNRVGEGVKEVMEVLNTLGFKKLARFKKRTLIL
ncbi:histidinol-phosphatase HisJ family protein [Haloimpatiens sp. FM7315]|uniref:histidinol-phosphatase HisJ family protein n=1 Tax=Haloimpatiens sp. FM7315 TaxID=3298609 RepID=UPI0035A2A969